MAASSCNNTAGAWLDSYRRPLVGISVPSGALDEDDRVRLTRHLAVCAGCRAEYDDLASVRCWLRRLAGRRE